MFSNTVEASNLLKFAHKLADGAGSAIQPYFRRRLSVSNKAGENLFDPVTEADKAAEATMRALISAEYPQHGVNGEEFPDKPADGPYTWVLDPIDGTRAFIMGLPVWGTLIGLTQNGAPVVGMMDQPYTRERFWAVEGGEAYFRDAYGEGVMRTRPCATLSEAVLAATAPDMFKGEDIGRFNALSEKTRMTRFGGDCYLYCMLAMGGLDLIAESSLKSFDIAPLVPIIRAAGGVVTTWDGGDPASGGSIIAAGDPHLHAEALKVLAG
jgi:histidinol phosphatase-like enzyme (inositol monophosphatase family)